MLVLGFNKGLDGDADMLLTDGYRVAKNRKMHTGHEDAGSNLQKVGTLLKSPGSTCRWKKGFSR